MSNNNKEIILYIINNEDLLNNFFSIYNVNQNKLGEDIERFLFDIPTTIHQLEQKKDETLIKRINHLKQISTDLSKFRKIHEFYKLFGEKIKELFPDKEFNIEDIIYELVFFIRYLRDVKNINYEYHSKFLLSVFEGYSIEEIKNIISIIHKLFQIEIEETEIKKETETKIKEEIEIINIFRKKYLEDFDKNTKGIDKIFYLRKIANKIKEEIDVDIDTIMDILYNFLEIQYDFFTKNKIKINKILDKVDIKSFYSKTEQEINELLDALIKDLSFEYNFYITNEDIKFMFRLLISQKLDEIETSGGSSKHHKLIKEIQLFLNKYKNRNNNKLIKILQRLKQS